MVDKDEIERIKGFIKVAEDMGDDETVRKYKAKLDKLTGGSSSSGSDFVIPGVSEDDYQSAGSKFAQAGVHLSEFGMPYWKTPGISMGFPFTIIDGPDKGKEGEIFVGVKKDAIWKLKEILSALGVETGKDKSGNVKFDPNKVAGQRAQTLWTAFKDTRSPEEGGKGTTYTKPTGVIAEGAAPPEDIT